jgi:hypothetical protein
MLEVGEVWVSEHFHSENYHFQDVIDKLDSRLDTAYLQDYNFHRKLLEVVLSNLK